MNVGLTGATGFVGGAVTRRLLRREHSVRALVRTPKRGGRLRDLGVEVVAGDIHDDAALQALFRGADAAVHLVGIIAEKGRETFERIHVTGTDRVVEAAGRAGVRRFVMMSALGARSDAEASAYHRTKAAAEEIVRRSGIPHAILRPSLIVGEGAVAARMVCDLVRLSPVVPVIGSGRYRVQPVWVEDVAEAFAVAVESPDLVGTFDVAGPEQVTWHEFLDRAERVLTVHRPRVSIPVGIARFAALAGLALPGLAPLTPDQLQLLLEGNTTEQNALDAVFGVKPRPIAEVVRDICGPHAPHPLQV